MRYIDLESHIRVQHGSLLIHKGSMDIGKYRYLFRIFIKKIHIPNVYK